MGFTEIEHTADCSMMVWADDLPSLFGEAARAMNQSAGARIGRGPRVRREVSVQAADSESLLVQFLTELIYAQEQEDLGFDQFDLQMSPGKLNAKLEGSLLEALAKPIKAVTYHNLSIQRTTRGYETEIVFDV